MPIEYLTLSENGCQEKINIFITKIAATDQLRLSDALFRLPSAISLTLDFDDLLGFVIVHVHRGIRILVWTWMHTIAILVPNCDCIA
jgi:hypothetical protein